MTEKRKPPNAGAGRVKGTPNVATKNARLAVAAFIDENTERLNHLLDEIERREGPREAFECLMRLIEHHIPRAEERPMSFSKVLTFCGAELIRRRPFRSHFPDEFPRFEANL
jgi:hypothetical protein